VTQGATPKTPDSLDHIVLAGIGREGANIVQHLAVDDTRVRKRFLTASPSRSLAEAGDALIALGTPSWQETLHAATAGTRMVVVVAAVTGREEACTPEVIAIAHRAEALTVAVLVEPLLSHSPHKSDAADALTRQVMRAADATLLFPAETQAHAALTLSEALERWTRRLNNALAGLLSAACAENAMDMDFADVAAVLSGHCRATVGAGQGKTVEDALRDAIKKSLAPPAEVETAHCVFAHVVGDADMPLDDARRVLPVLEHLFPKAQVGCGVGIDPDLDEIQATIIAGKLEAPEIKNHTEGRTGPPEPTFFKVGDPTVYEGENLDVPAFVRQGVELPGRPPQAVPSQKTLFDGPARSE